MGTASFPGSDTTLRDRIEWARATKGLRKSALAERLGVSASRVSEWTRNASPVTPNSESLASLSLVLDVDVGWLASGYGSPNDEDTEPEDPVLSLYNSLLSQHGKLSDRYYALERLMLDLLMAVTESGAVKDADASRLRDAAASLTLGLERPRSGAFEALQELDKRGELQRLDRGRDVAPEGSPAARAGARAAKAGRQQSVSTPETSPPNRRARKA